jgi:membrane-bound ClpP family serine protease
MEVLVRSALAYRRANSHGRTRMAVAVALLSHPAGSYLSLLVAVIAGLYAAQSRRFVPAVMCVSTASLTLLGFHMVPPTLAGLVWLAAGIALLHAEFLWPTFGVAGLLGVGSAVWGSSILLSTLVLPARGAVALLGAATLLVAVGRTMRLRTLPPQP